MVWCNHRISSPVKVFICGSGGYNLLLSKNLPFPSIRTLNRRIEKLKVPPGILEEFFKLLKVKVEAMKDSDKICTLSFDEMSIVEGQKYSPWKNHLSRYKLWNRTSFKSFGVYDWWNWGKMETNFTSSSTDPVKMKEIIIELLGKCQEIGLHVINITSGHWETGSLEIVRLW